MQATEGAEGAAIRNNISKVWNLVADFVQIKGIAPSTHTNPPFLSHTQTHTLSLSYTHKYTHAHKTQLQLTPEWHTPTITVSTEYKRLHASMSLHSSPVIMSDYWLQPVICFARHDHTFWCEKNRADELV